MFEFLIKCYNRLQSAGKSVDEVAELMPELPRDFIEYCATQPRRLTRNEQSVAMGL